MQGRNLTDVCKEEGVGFLVWSSLPDVTALTGGKVCCLMYVSHALQRTTPKFCPFCPNIRSIKK